MNNQKKLGELLNKLHLRISSETKPPSITHLITLTKLLTHILNPNQLTIPGLNLIQLIETLPDKWLAPHVHPNIHPGDGDAKGDGGGVEVILSSTVIEQIVVHLFRLLPEPGYRKVGSFSFALCGLCSGRDRRVVGWNALWEIFIVGRAYSLQMYTHSHLFNTSALVHITST
eukprot:848606-Amorphochlora_amoeboformis.AAC.1